MRGQVQYVPCRISHLQSYHLIMKCSFEDKGQQMMHRLGGRTSYTQSHSHALLLLGWVLRILNFPLFSSAFLWESEAFQFVAKIHAKKQQQQQPPVKTNQPTEDLPLWLTLCSSHRQPLCITSSLLCSTPKGCCFQPCLSNQCCCCQGRGLGSAWELFSCLHGKLNQN